MKRFKHLSWIPVVLFLFSPAHASDASGNGATTTTVLPAAVAEGAPRFEVPEGSYDLGKISPDQQYEHIFTVKNTGTAILEIEKITVG